MVNQAINRSPQRMVSSGKNLYFLIPKIPTYKLNTPFIVNRIIPGIRKFLKEECSKNSMGICIISPEGSYIRTPPPKRADKALKNNKIKAIFRVEFFICLFLFFDSQTCLSIDGGTYHETQNYTQV